MEIPFIDGETKMHIDTLSVEPNSIIKDVLLEFLKRNNYNENLYLYHFVCGRNFLNSPKFIDRRVKKFKICGFGGIQFFKKFTGGEHICPYGCGRLIPNEYKGCTELLQANPNYFY